MFICIEYNCLFYVHIMFYTISYFIFSICIIHCSTSKRLEPPLYYWGFILLNCSTIDVFQGVCLEKPASCCCWRTITTLASFLQTSPKSSLSLPGGTRRGDISNISLKKH